MIGDDRAEPPIRRTLPGGRIGVPSGRSYPRTLAETAFWLGVAPVPPRLLWRVGAHGASSRLQRWWARGVARTLGMQIDWQGLDLIDPGEAYVVAPLHEGLADAIALLQLPLQLRFVLRDEFEEWPLVGGYLRDTEQVTIRPEAGTRAYRRLLKQACRVLARGESLVICPQGTILGIETDFNPGAFAVARALERPILPVALTGTHRVWEFPYSPRLRHGERVSVRVLPPVPACEVREREVDDLRRDVQRRLKTAALDGTMAPPRRFVPARDGYWDGFAFEIDPDFPVLAADVTAHREARVARSACCMCKCGLGLPERGRALSSRTATLMLMTSERGCDAANAQPPMSHPGISCVAGSAASRLRQSGTLIETQPQETTR